MFTARGKYLKKVFRIYRKKSSLLVVLAKIDTIDNIPIFVSNFNPFDHVIGGLRMIGADLSDSNRKYFVGNGVHWNMLGLYFRKIGWIFRLKNCFLHLHKKIFG